MKKINLDVFTEENVVADINEKVDVSYNISRVTMLIQPDQNKHNEIKECMRQLIYPCILNKFLRTHDSSKYNQFQHILIDIEKYWDYRCDQL